MNVLARKGKILAFAIILIILISGICVYNIYNIPREQYITMAELMEDFVKYDSGGGFFRSYDDGDTVKIKDIILYIETTSPSSNQTYIWFDSTGKDGYSSALVFEGNLTPYYHVGDKVIVTLNIVEFHQGERTYEAWGKLSGGDIKHV